MRKTFASKFVEASEIELDISLERLIRRVSRWQQGFGHRASEAVDLTHFKSRLTLEAFNRTQSLRLFRRLLRRFRLASALTRVGMNAG